METKPDRPDLTGFRSLLGVGAAVTGVIGVAGILGGGLLLPMFGPDLPDDAPGFVAVARLLGAASLTLAVGYVLAAAHPLRSRGLLVLGFVAPLLTAVATIIAAAKGELSGVRGGVFAAVELSYVLLYFRLYPKPAAEAEGADEPAAAPEGSSGPTLPSSEGDEGSPPSA